MGGSYRFQPHDFFYGVLITETSEEVAKVIRAMEKEAMAIEENIIDICIEMKGGIGWTEAWSLTPTTRNTMVGRINQHNRRMSGDTTEYF